ncbi:MAG: glutamate racemase [Campylobacteraceae bacterium 4484_166]|nr:MAG: glutamate racemase [Campylobacteraceae bacterium 4484_166]
MTVGIFDSGVGGLTVAKPILEQNLFDEIIYFGDTARVPYGNKDKNTIVRYSLEALEFFKNFDIDMLIVACNTASVHAIEELRASTNIPIVGVIEAGVNSLSKQIDDKQSKILIIGTKATIQSNSYEKRLLQEGYKNTISIATPLFVPIVEENLQNTKILDETMKQYFKDIKGIDVVILGCTHFPLIDKEIKKYFTINSTIHSGEAICDMIKERYRPKKPIKKTNIKFFASENPQQLENRAKEWLLTKYI